MRRKIIQIAGSTQLVSLPRQWAKKHNLKRGQEVEVKEDGNSVIVKASTKPFVETAHLDISNLGDMTRRCIHALYKRGVDELRVTFNNSSDIITVQNAIGTESVGFEILEQSENHCTIKYVSGTLHKFDSILRRTFLLLISMSTQTYGHLKERNFTALRNTAFLEEANNRFTTICRRHLNKSPAEYEQKIGPMYYLLEELEKLADQYKYICQHFSKLKNKSVKIEEPVFTLFKTSNDMLRTYYELFYKFDSQKLVNIKGQRDAILDKGHSLLQKNLNYANNWLIYHALVISSKIFEMTGPLMSLKL